jgi:hypothetical protein
VDADGVDHMQFEAFTHGKDWMAMRAQLAALYRKAGREREARAVVAQLRKLLVVADPDHPLLQRLNETTGLGPSGPSPVVD